MEQMLGPVRFGVSASPAPLLPWQDGRGPHQGTTLSLLLLSTQKKGVQGSGMGLLAPGPRLQSEDIQEPVLVFISIVS